MSTTNGPAAQVEQPGRDHYGRINTLTAVCAFLLTVTLAIGGWIVKSEVAQDRQATVATENRARIEHLETKTENTAQAVVEIKSDVGWIRRYLERGKTP